MRAKSPQLMREPLGRSTRCNVAQENNRWRSAMSNRLVIIGAPSSAGAYAPGQEKAPAALRAAGLLEFLSAGGITVDDLGDISGFRWRAEKANPRAMNANAASTVAKATAERVAS